MIELLGIVGAVVLTVGVLPQLVKVIGEGHADGLAAGLIWCWVAGFLTLFIYTVVRYPHDFTLMINYGCNFLISLIFLKYKYRNRTT